MYCGISQVVLLVKNPLANAGEVRDVATGRISSVFIPVSKKSNDKECSNYHTIVLISHACKIML